MYAKDVMRMRRTMALSTALCLLLLSPPASADIAPAPTPLPGYTLRASPEEIRVFATRSMKANIVGYITPGDSQEVRVLSVSDDWCYIEFTSAYGVSYGYVPLSSFDVAPKPTPTPVPGPSYEAGTPAWIQNRGDGYRLNLREEPSSSSKSIGKYYTGTPVTLTGQVKDGFAQVLLAGTALGWMDIRFLTTDAVSFVPETPIVTVKNDGASLRSGPSTSYNRLNWYPKGTAVTVLGVRTDGWYHVQVDEQVGYMADSVLSGTFPFEYGMDSDNPSVTDSITDQTSVFYINTRTAGGQLHLRKSASSTSKSLGLFYTGTPLTIISYTRTGWVYVRIGQTEGYMDVDYLTSTKPTQYGESRIIRNTRATGLNLRSLPSTGGELLDFAPNYSSVIVLGELSDGWCYVEYDGALGYMLGTSLEKAK